MHRVSVWLRVTVQRLLSENTDPARLGVAVGIGVLFACTPFYGFQLWLALAFAWVFRLNKVAVAIGTQFSFPPFIPFIVLASVWIGEVLVHGRTPSLDRSQFQSASARELLTQFGAAWVVGGLVVGAVAGTVIGAGVTVIAARRARRGLPSADLQSPSDPAAD
ncbi:MAG: DUF2062 domain-containing protein [Gemmatimonadaceae bacterium]